MSLLFPATRLLALTLLTTSLLAACGQVPGQRALGPAKARVLAPEKVTLKSAPRALNEIVVASRDPLPPQVPGAVAKDHFSYAGITYHLLSVPQPSLMQRVLGTLRGAPRTERAEVNRASQSAEAPNDEFYPLQYGLTAKRLATGWSKARGAGVMVAVIDTGVDYRHPDLQGQVIQGPDLVNSGDDDGPMDDRGHGTHCAGIIAAVAGNGVGIAGVAPGAKLYAVKVLNGQGQGSAYLTAKGVLAAVNAGCRIINMSLGGTATDSALRGFYESLVKADILVVAAAGNDGEAVGFPAAFEGVLSVGATDEMGVIAGFSNRGLNLGVTAPGVGILSTVPGAFYQQKSGTSMAAPYVSGVAALVWGQHPDWSAQQVKRHLESTATDKGTPGLDATYGHGEINPLGALDIP